MRPRRRDTPYPPSGRSRAAAGSRSRCRWRRRTRRWRRGRSRRRKPTRRTGPRSRCARCCRCSPWGTPARERSPRRRSNRSAMRYRSGSSSRSRRTRAARRGCSDTVGRTGRGRRWCTRPNCSAHAGLTVGVGQALVGAALTAVADLTQGAVAVVPAARDASLVGRAQVAERTVGVDATARQRDALAADVADPLHLLTVELEQRTVLIGQAARADLTEVLRVAELVQAAAAVVLTAAAAGDRLAVLKLGALAVDLTAVLEFMQLPVETAGAEQGAGDDEVPQCRTSFCSSMYDATKTPADNTIEVYASISRACPAEAMPSISPGPRPSLIALM